MTLPRGDGGGGGGSYVVVDVLPQVEEADPDKLYLVPMIDAWYNGSLSRCFITQNERPSYADDLSFVTIVVESGDAVVIGSDGTRDEVVMHEYDTVAQSESQAGDSKFHCSPETFHYKAFKIDTGEFGTFWILAEAPSWVTEAE